MYNVYVNVNFFLLFGFLVFFFWKDIIGYFVNEKFMILKFFRLLNVNKFIIIWEEL